MPTDLIHRIGIAAPAVWRNEPESGAEATALQTLARLPDITELREASGLRRVYRRYCASISPGATGNGQ